MERKPLEKPLLPSAGSGWRVEATIARGFDLAKVLLVYRFPTPREPIELTLYENADAHTNEDFAIADRYQYLLAAIARFFNAGGNVEELENITNDLWQEDEETGGGLPMIDTDNFEPLGMRQRQAETQYYFREMATNEVIVIEEGVFVERYSWEEFQRLFGREQQHNTLD